MGSLFSYSLNRKEKGRKSQLEIATRQACPSYFIDDVVINNSDIALTTNSWNILMSGEQTIPFKRNSALENFNYATSLSWFFDIFYEKFFSLCPETRPMFTHVSIVSQGKLLAGVISSSLAYLTESDRLKARLSSMVKAHNQKGVKALYYGCMGEALVWALGTVIGEEFTYECRLSWYRVYSYLLGIILPDVVKYEIEQSRRLQPWISRSNSYSYSNSFGRRIESELERVLQPKLSNKLALKKKRTMPVTILVHCNS